MFTHPRLRWAPFYMLVPLTAALLYLDQAIPMTPAWRTIILLAIVLLISGLAVDWIERHARIIERERPSAHTYRVIFCPWSAFQCPASRAEGSDVSEDESIRQEETPIRHVCPPSGN